MSLSVWAAAWGHVDVSCGVGEGQAVHCPLLSCSILETGPAPYLGSARELAQVVWVQESWF